MDLVMAGLFVSLPILIVVLKHYLGYTETDASGNAYRRRLFQAQRVCLGCGLIVRTAIPTCPSCGRSLPKEA